jgi:hypothetical protein
MNDLNLSGPDPEAIVTHIRNTYPDTAILESGGTWFFSLDAERHFPNFATIVTNDDYDEGSNLSRPGVFRLNIGVDRATFGRLVGHEREPDFAALDRFLPHPTYARQHWISILNPNASRFEIDVKPLIALAYDRLATARARHPR